MLESFCWGMALLVWGQLDALKKCEGQGSYGQQFHFVVPIIINFNCKCELPKTRGYLPPT